MDKPKYKTFSAVVPAYNEAKRCCHVLTELLKIKALSELVFVDDGSTDDTEKKIQQFLSDSRFIYVQHKKNKGKGVALKTGLDKAKNEVILFIDADLENITAQKINKIIAPVLNDEVDVARGAFKLARGRVTEIAVKPMMRILFPDMYFDQPISGQVCAKKDFLMTIDFESKWGVDIGILIDAISAGQRIVEVDIGKLEHKARTTVEKAEMAEQVLHTMIQKAGLIHHKYNLVVFTLDDTLIPAKSLQLIFKKLGIVEPIEKNIDSSEQEEISFNDFLIRNAKLFNGIETEKIEKICQEVPLAKYAHEVISALKKRKYQVALISSNFSPIVKPIAKRLGVSIYSCVELAEKNGIIKSEITSHSRDRWLGKDMEVAFKGALSSIMRRAIVKASQTIMVASSERSIPLMKSVGLAIAYKPKSKELKEVADKTISLHAELLAIIE